ncbi:hypothetical protein BP5796_05234 [Coleophoma crateriformis]|uniref:FAM50A/XAP5 C-terminal domain-containing protein n=1 Tax=Coleophoma crateriformis TaxID=565419 RepID=A0A3D8S2P9_9HELO|nr:hypothetical protein BP5796_05234 [Coleophoma crateriformis]
MASNPGSGASTPNPRFAASAKTAEDLLSKQTEGLVNLSDFRKRRAEAIEQKERDAHDSVLGGRATPGTATPDGVSTPKEAAPKKKKRKVGTPKLSFGDDEEEEGGGDGGNNTEATTDSASNSRSGTPLPRKKLAANSSVAVAPKALTKSALLRDAQTRETLRKEFLVIQEQVKATEIAIPFVFYDGTNIPGGVCRVSKGDFIWVFLDRSRKVGAELGVGEKANSRREWARIGVDDLMMVRGSIIIPHHYDFYYFIMNRNIGPKNRPLFDYSAEPPSNAPAAEVSLEKYDPLARPTKAKAIPIEELEGAQDDPTFTKVVDRRWYERNKHIFPASVWQEFDPEKDYQNEIKRDAGGNAFFFS